MDFFSTVVVAGGTFAAVGLIVLGLAATRAAVLLGMHEAAPWWFTPRGGRTQGFVLAYLGVLVALSGAVGLAVHANVPDSRSLAWTLTWVTFVLLAAVTVTRAGAVAVRLASGGRGAPDEPLESDRVEATIGADDPDLLSAREHALEGRWDSAAHLLAATGDAEMREMRIGLLADVAGRRRSWLESWLRTNPEDPNALAVQAAVALQRAAELASGASPADRTDRVEAIDDALDAARQAIRRSPEDPSPWVTLVRLAEVQDVERVEFEARLAGALERAPGLRQAHEAAIFYLENVSSDSPSAVLAYAESAAQAGPSGRTTALLPAVAHLAHFLTIAGRDPKAADAYMESTSTRTSLRAASDRWLAEPSPICRPWGHNLLAFCGWLAEDAELAAPHLVHTYEALDPWPWMIAGEPGAVHAEVRAWARQRLAKPAVFDVPDLRPANR